MRLSYIVAIPVCLVLTFVVAGRLRWPGSVGVVPPEFAQQKAKWAAKQPARYILTVTHTSGVAPSWFTLSQVTRGKVDNVLCRRYGGKESVTECAVTDALFPVTAEQLFAAVETAYLGKFGGIEIQYDARSGCPTQIHFDPSKDKAGDEWGYEVELLEAAPGV